MFCSSSTFWNGVKYGNKSDPASLLTIEVSTTRVEKEYMMENKTVIFLVDISGSMKDALPSVQASLLAFRDTVIGKKTNATKDDELFRTKCHTELITFSSVINEVWSSKTAHPSLTFSDAVASLETGGSTNMGDGLRIAFTKCPPRNLSWIVVLTDGDSNCGLCQTLTSFQSLVRQKPRHTKIVTLGYGTNFKPEILTCVGSFTYLEDIESITYLMGSMYHEISTAKFFGVTIGAIPTSLGIVIGENDVGVMFNERKFIFGATMPAGVGKAGISVDTLGIVPGGIFDAIQIHFFVLTSDGIKEETKIDRVLFSTDNELPVYINQAYYISEAARFIEEVYTSAMASSHDKISKIKEIVSGWTEECAIQPRETVLRIIEKLNSTHGKERASAMRMAVSGGRAAKTQTSYVDRTYMSPSSILAAQQTQNLSEQYH